MNLDYEKRYTEALEKASIAYKDEDKHLKATLERIFPELKGKESDERTRKAILTGLIDCRDAPDLGWSDFGGINIDECIAWIEKQSEKQHSHIDVNKMVDEFAHTEVKGYGVPSMIEADAYRKGIEDVLEKQGEQNFDYEHADIPQKDFAPIEPKFKVGDWITSIDDEGKVSTQKIIDFWGDKVRLVDLDEYFTLYPKSELNNYHLWTIQDAKDGDLIYVSTETKGLQAIFHKFENGIIYFHCNLCGDFAQGGYELSSDVKSVNPLLKEHYQRFFQKMKEAGYKWDGEKKELWHKYL